MVYQSYIVMLNRCLVAYPLVSQGILALCMIVVVSSLKKWMLEMVVAEWRCYQHVSASPSQHKFLCMFFELAEIPD